jgi:hypothetical protein
MPGYELCNVLRKQRGIAITIFIFKVKASLWAGGRKCEHLRQWRVGLLKSMLRLKTAKTSREHLSQQVAMPD